ncbi:MAG: hypothetical protein ABW215_23255 [Kibdelosporangium sp.]
MTDLADRADLAPELRLVPHAFRESFGRPAAGVWYAPGVVSLLPGVSVCARWGAIVAADHRADGVLELASINKPAEPVLLPLDRFTAVRVPAWARPIARLVQRLEPAGATLLCSVDLPAGSGLSAPNALACAAALALRDLGRPDMPLGQLIDIVAQGVDVALVESAFTGGTTGFDPAGGGLLVIDTRIRRDTPVRATTSSPPGYPPVAELGQWLTAHHCHQGADLEQDIAVSAAIEGGAFGASMVLDEPGRPVAALADPAGLGVVRSYVAEAFRRETLRAPRFLTVRPAVGAHRVTV